MWCPACRADVAAELSHDSRHFCCARCRTELGTAVGALGAALPAALPPTDAERNARELLARWNAQNVLESPQPPRAYGAISHSPPSVDSSNSQSSISSASIDPAMKVELSDSIAPAPRRRRKRRRVDVSERLPIIEDRLPTAAESLKIRPASWGIAIGQVCAYFGIGLITCGTAVVLWGYFGGPPQVAPSGWLVTTVGQMFLFLGVVTLISSGMEQTSADVAARIDVLGQRLIRFEQLHRPGELAGPHRQFPSRRRRHDLAADTESQTAEPL